MDNKASHTRPDTDPSKASKALDLSKASHITLDSGPNKASRIKLVLDLNKEDSLIKLGSDPSKDNKVLDPSKDSRIRPALDLSKDSPTKLDLGLKRAIRLAMGSEVNLSRKQQQSDPKN